jgi:phenylacetate-CoA ligase
MGSLPGVAAYRFVIDRAAHLDSLRCELVPEPGVDVDTLASDVRERARSTLRFAIDVVVVPTVEGGPIVDRRTWE